MEMFFIVSSPKIEVKETNGAGDVFHGAFAKFIETKTTKKRSNWQLLLHHLSALG